MAIEREVPPIVRALYDNVAVCSTVAVWIAFAWSMLRRSGRARRAWIGLAVFCAAWLVLGWLAFGFDSGMDGMTPVVRRVTLGFMILLALLLPAWIGPWGFRGRAWWEGYKARCEEKAEREHARSGVHGLLLVGVLFLAAWLALRHVVSPDVSFVLYAMGAAWCLIAAGAKWTWSGPGQDNRVVRHRRARIASVLVFVLGVPLMIVLWQLLT